MKNPDCLDRLRTLCSAHKLQANLFAIRLPLGHCLFVTTFYGLHKQLFFSAVKKAVISMQTDKPSGRRIRQTG